MSSLYDADFNRWTLEQTAALRAGRFQDLDLENLAEEIEGLSKSDKRAIKSQLVRLLFHLLKLRFQPDQPSASWRNSVQDARFAIASIIEDSPSLRNYPAESLEAAYQKARDKDPENPTVDTRRFPASCPWTIAQALDERYWPEAVRAES